MPSVTDKYGNRIKSSGIFLPLASLPGLWPCGRADKYAFDFIDFLSQAGQSYWQVLPLGPMDDKFCPYSAISAMAIDPLYIDPNLFVTWGLLFLEDIQSIAGLSSHAEKISYAEATRLNHTLLKIAFSSFVLAELTSKQASQFEEFCHQNHFWLEDFSLYQVLSDLFGSDWRLWPDALKCHDQSQLKEIAFEQKNLLLFHKFCQFFADLSWQSLRAYAHQRGIKLMGDMPIYVNLKSADVWSHQQSFSLDAQGSPIDVSGVPPDPMCPEGQKWFHPLYDWQQLKNTGYSYWTSKLKRTLKLYDLVRLDHFIAFQRYFSIPFDKDPSHGHWRDGPGAPFFEVMQKALGSLPFVAEDLGTLTPEVTALRRQFGIPGMGVFIFGFDVSDVSHHPDRVLAEQVYYSSTHDTPTLMEWWASSESQAQISPSRALEWDRMSNFLLTLKKTDETRENWVIIRRILHSEAQLTLFPLPDLLGLKGEGRINIPGTEVGNWLYRSQVADFSDNLAQELAHYTEEAGR